MRSFRGLVLLAFPVLPAIVLAAEHGCSSSTPVESACDWVEYPGNCARQFHNDMLLYGATQDNPWGDCRTYPQATPSAQRPTEANPNASTIAGKLGVANGYFTNRASLDTCIITSPGGGSVKIDPPIDLTMFPPTLVTSPTTYTLTFTSFDGNTCGTATYTSPHGFTITVNGAGGGGTGPSTGAGGGSGAGGGTTSVDAGVDAGPPVNTSVNPDTGAKCPSGLIDWSDAGVPIFTGTYAQVITPGSDIYNVTCPSGETHNFNLDEIDGPPNVADGGAYSSCPGLAPSVPAASFQVYPGSTDQAGAVSFAIYYPNPCLPPDAGIVYDEPTQRPDAVVYFNCTVPGALETCVDTVKDGAETDVDCGGPYMLSKCYSQCPARCNMGQLCLVDCDCAGGFACKEDPTSGMKTCQPGTQVTCNYPLTNPSANVDGGAPGCPVIGTGTGGGGTGGGATGAGGGSSSSTAGAGGGASRHHD